MNRREFLQVSATAPASGRLMTEAGVRPTGPRWEQKLDGIWYFHPEQNLGAGDRPQDPRLHDEGWPEIDVPNFWRPIEYWLWDPGDGASMRYSQREIDRVRRYRFDPYATRGAWYRRWIDVPSRAAGQRLFVKFWAVAMIAEVWWNGERVGSHLGMFGPFTCAMTGSAKPGMNLLTVFVSGGSWSDVGALEKLKARDVTVDLSSPWLNDLPQSIYYMCGKEGGGGIWQSVQLHTTDQVRIADVFFQPRLDGARVEVTIDNGSSSGASRTLRYTITDAITGSLLVEEERPMEVKLTAGQTETVALELPRVQPKLWSPEEPNLYDLEVELWEGSRKADLWHDQVGFRTFQVRGTRFYLNEKPYFLRGATQPPYGLAPWDSDLARRYFELLRAGNEQITAFNETGGNDVWSSAADRIGIGIIDQGAWTWALQSSTDPPKEQIEVWKKIHAELVVAVRNHPCILLRSINDEAWFHYLPPHALGNPPDQGKYLDSNRERRLRKWQIVSDVVKLTRRLDPTRPIGASGGYARSAEEWKDLEPLGIDDGDFDNVHVFHGTYGPSYFCLDVQRDIENRYSMGQRPLITDQAGTGYPDNDIGFVCGTYINSVRTPQAWVGDLYIYDPRLPFLEVNGQIIKEGYEKIRRHKSLIAGWLIFSNCQWFRNVYDARSIEPYSQIYDGVTRALEPLMVSLDNPNRHFVAGDRFISNVYVVHDDIRRGHLEGLQVRWSWFGPCDFYRAGGSAELPSLGYYETVRTQVQIDVPEAWPMACCRGTLRLELFAGPERLSWNEYPVWITERQWRCVGPKEAMNLTVIGQDADLERAFQSVGVTVASAKSWRGSKPGTVIVFSPSAPAERLKSEVEALRNFVNDGAVVVFHNPTEDQALALGFRTQNIPKHFREHIWDTPAGPWAAEYADLDKSHPLADGIDPVYHMRWWNAEGGAGPRVADRVISSADGTSEKVSILGKEATALCTYVAPHGYYNAPWDFLRLFRRPVLVEAAIGKGAVIVSTLRTAPDPLALRVFLNLLRYSSGRTAGAKRVRYF